MLVHLDLSTAVNRATNGRLPDVLPVGMGKETIHHVHRKLGALNLCHHSKCG